MKQEILQRLQVHSPAVGNRISWLAGPVGPVGLHLAGTHFEVGIGSDQRRSGFCLALEADKKQNDTRKDTTQIYTVKQPDCSAQSVFSLRRLFKSSMANLSFQNFQDTRCRCFALRPKGTTTCEL